MSQLFASGGQIIGASASAAVLPINIQDWFPLLLTDLTSLLSMGLSRVFSSTTIQKHHFFSTQSSLWSNSHICTGKTIALTIQIFVGKVISLLFNTPSRFVIASFSSKEQASFHSVLQSLSAVILDTKKMKSVTASTFFPFYLPWSDGTGVLWGKFSVIQAVTNDALDATYPEAGI